MADSFLPGTDAGLLAWAQNFYAYILVHYAAVGLSQDQATDMKDATLALAAAMATASNASTRTRPTIEAKKAQRAAVIAMARGLVRVVQIYPSLMDEQRRAMKITVPKPRSRQPVVAVRPGMRVVSVVGRDVTVDIYDPTSATKRNKAPGAVDAWVYSYVGTTYPSDPTAWSFNGATGKTRFMFTVADSVPAGAQLWICAAWVNRAGAGPTSIPIATNVQGGGANEQASTLKIAA